MAQPRAVARSLRKTATQLAKIPDTALAEVVEATVAEAPQIGGRFGRRGRRLLAEAKVRKRKSQSSAVVFGRPAGAWVIKSFGRGPVVPRRRKALRAGDRFFMSAGSAGPIRQQSWERVVEFANDKADEVWGDQVDRVVSGG